MSARAEFLAMLALAAALHVLALGWISPGGGGSGAHGDARISVAAASANLTAEVADWERVPATSPAVVDAMRAPDTDTIPELAAHIDGSVSHPAPLALAPIESVSAPVAFEAGPAIVAAPLEPPPADLARTPGADTSLERPDIARLANPPAPSAKPVSALAPERVAVVPPRPKSRPSEPPSENVTRRIARSNGTGVRSGESAAPDAVGLSRTNRQSAQAVWAAEIQRRIARQQRYPRGTRATGRVQVHMTVMASGRLSAVGLAQSSGTEALDIAAIRAVERAAPFPPAPEELVDDWFRVSQWITFERR